MSLPPLEQLQDVWKELAGRYFADRLPPISIVWSSRLTASSGMFVSRVGPRSRTVPVEVRQGTSRVIRLSGPLLRDQPMDEVVRTLAHEMIHQWQFDIRHCRPSHGHDFLAKMHQMNHDGMGVSLYHQLDDAVLSWNRYAWRCVDCGLEYRRQRRTISTRRHRCARCGGKLKETHVESPDLPVFDETLSLPEQPLPGLKEEKTLKEPVQLALPF